MNRGFAGFPEEGMAFFRGLLKHNKREWFQPRKQIFEEKLKAPMTELVMAVNAELRKFAPEHVTDPAKAIFRIYRDTRFSKDKTPYKTHIAASFSRRGAGPSAGFYFSVSPKEIGVAGGLYAPGPAELLAVRTHLTQHHREFRKLVGSAKLRKLLGELHGEQLTRAPKGFDPQHASEDLVRYKRWVFYTTLDGALATTPALFTEIVKRLKAVAPVVEFLNAPLAARRAPDPLR